jgi:hypothetical protein
MLSGCPAAICIIAPSVEPSCPPHQVGLTVKLVMGGSDSQRLLVAYMRRAEETRLMMTVNHKGRVAYANTGIATLLGFKLPALKARDFCTLLPPPYNVLHSKWLKVGPGRKVEGATRQCPVHQPYGLWHG